MATDRLLFTFLLLITTVQSARILGVFLTPQYSHFILGETLFKELAARGHNVTVINSFPQKEKLENYEDIVVTETAEFRKLVRSDESLVELFRNSAVTILTNIHNMCRKYVDLGLQNGNVQNFLKSNETFDLIIIEYFLSEALLGFGHRFKAPVIAMSTLGHSLWTNVLTWNPAPFSYVPHIFLDYSPEMNIPQRLHNSLISTYEVLYIYGESLPRQDEMLHKYFPDAPPIYDLINNISLFFLNTHPACAAAIPRQPNMIEIGGFHVNKYKPLSEDLKKFLDNASEGVVYFSLGSSMNTIGIQGEKFKNIIKVFARLKMKVLLKWENDTLRGKPDNVRIEKWLPQPAVLAHENVKIFITHGGRLSTIESIYFGKPFLGIPIFAEQHSNMREAAYLGYGIYLSYDDLNEENFAKALMEIIINPKYAEIARSRSRALHESPIPPMELAINRIEYIIRNKGAPHLRGAGVRLRWYQYLLLDVVLYCYVLIWMLKKLFCYLVFKIFKFKVEREKVKQN